MSSWTKNYIKVTGTGLFNDVKKFLVKLDVDGASEADIMTLDDNLTICTQKVAEQLLVAKKERKEAVDITAAYNAKLNTLEILQADLATETDEAVRADIQAAIDEELAAVEEMVPEVEREIQEAEEAESDLKEFQAVAAAGAKTLKAARANLANAQKNLERQKVALARAEEREARAKELAGLNSSLTKLNTALDVMKEEASDLEKQAAAKRIKTDLLEPKDTTSDVLKNARARAMGAPAPTASVADRMAALKKF